MTDAGACDDCDLMFQRRRGLRRHRRQHPDHVLFDHEEEVDDHWKIHGCSLNAQNYRRALAKQLPPRRWADLIALKTWWTSSVRVEGGLDWNDCIYVDRTDGVVLVASVHGHRRNVQWRRVTHEAVSMGHCDLRGWRRSWWEKKQKNGICPTCGDEDQEPHSDADFDLLRRLPFVVKCQPEP